MMPAAVDVEAVDEVKGGLEALEGRADEEVVRLVMRDDVDLVRQVALLTQIITSAHHKLTLRVVEQVRALRVIVHTVSVVKQRGPHLNFG